MMNGYWMNHGYDYITLCSLFHHSLCIYCNIYTLYLFTNCIK